jgi:hypothetical protein
MVHSFAVSQQDFKNLDAVEIKMTIADEQKDRIRELLPVDLEPQRIRVYFFDTADLELFETHQVILRGRRKEKKADDSTVKLRRVEPNWTFAEWRKAKGEFKVEGDWVSDKLIRSASFTVEQEEGKIEQVETGKTTVDKLFSKEQEQFLENAVSAPIDFSSLKVLGPSETYKWKMTPPGFDGEICLEYWQLADPKDVLQDKKEILEVSTKVDCDRAQIVWEQFNQFLQQHGIDPGGKQEPKTRTALEFFAGLIQRSKFL